MTKEQLIEAGFKPQAGPYLMPKEDIIFSRAVRQFSKTGGDPYFLLWSEERDSVEIWTNPTFEVEPAEED